MKTKTGAELIASSARRGGPNADHRTKMDLTGKTFAWIVGGYGDVLFEVTSGPITAADGSAREFVWAKAVGRIQHSKGRAPFRLPPTKGPFFLPIKFQS